MLRTLNSLSAHRLSPIVLSIISALLLILSFPNFNLWFLAWIGFIPLFWAIKNKSIARAFLFSYLTGVLFWLGIIYWLVHVTLTGMFILVLYLALYFGLFGLLVSAIGNRPFLPSRQALTIDLFIIPSLWVILEYGRSYLLTGFPWALLGYSQYLNLPLIQIADITGAYGVSFLVMLVNVTIYSVLGSRFSVLGKKKQYLIPALLLFVVLTYGYYKLSRTPNTEHRTPIKISLIQGNIPQELKWDKGSSDFIISRYLELTGRAAKDKPDLIIWPEASFPEILEEAPFYYQQIQDAAAKYNTYLLFGAATNRGGSYFNSALLISRQGQLLQQYDKIHLVPFGEYIPLRDSLKFIETVVPIGDFTAGREYRLFQAPANFAVLICFEDVFPELSRRFISRGAEFLINITNDAWFKKTSSPYQHLQASVFRAIENRVYVVRSANTGVSGFISPAGKIISLLTDKTGRNIFIDGYLTQKFSIPKRGLSFYNRYPGVLILLCFIFMIYGTIAAIKKTKKA